MQEGEKGVDFQLHEGSEEEFVPQLLPNNRERIPQHLSQGNPEGRNVSEGEPVLGGPDEESTEESVEESIPPWNPEIQNGEDDLHRYKVDALRPRNDPMWNQGSMVSLIIISTGNRSPICLHILDSSVFVLYFKWA